MGTQIKVTPEQLEQAAKSVRNTRSSLEYIHKDLYSQTEYIASQWSGASSDRFYQMFNEAKPMMFNILQELDKITVELERAAVKFRDADELYGGNLVDSDIQEGAMCGKLPPKSEESFFNKKDLYAAWEGLISLGDKETWLNMRDAIVNYRETIPAAWNTVSDTFMNKFWNGDIEGFPIFESKGEIMLKGADFKKSRTTQSRKCSKALYEQIMENPELALKFTDEEIQLFKIGKTPEHYTWHHHQDTGRMQLVDYQTHHDTGHTGGYKILGKDSDK
ncbi:WXG100 family type VII secretion target [Bacillus cereus VD196]|uniref:WXG100 family type VII secretion target n=1 Tax=Bacillus cereus VD196 TaxID=1053243 RepID=A0A9W5PXP0_BACCE|nr:WXG100 family type VII secretion target [Bacillus cereus]EOO57415.1 WXG100 family type VII secretion target [Bacillus cereus VD196]